MYITLLQLVLFITANYGVKINNFETPVDWVELTIPFGVSSMITVMDGFGGTYLCGGKTGPYTTSKKCIKISITKDYDSDGIENFILNVIYDGYNGIKTAGMTPGFWYKPPGFFSDTQHEGSIYDNRLYLLSLNDGLNGDPNCWGCNINDIENYKNPKYIYCDNLEIILRNGCPKRYSSCLINDKFNHIIYQIGGYYGFDQYYDDILCFDSANSKYIPCDYNTLQNPLFGVGCTIMPSESDSKSIVIVGGKNTLSSSQYSQSIYICNENENENTYCNELDIYLEDGVFNTRVIAIDICHIGIIGGLIKNNADGTDIRSNNLHIANICNQEWIESIILPAGIGEFGIIKSNGIFCIYGGFTDDNNNNNPPILNKKIYCTNLGNTLTVTPTINPSDKQSTLIPTIYPTNNPTTLTPTTKQPTTYKPTTEMPTIYKPPNTGNIEINDATFHNRFTRFDNGISAQICNSDNNYLYVCGGYNYNYNDQYSLNMNNQCYYYDENGVQNVLNMYIKNNDNVLQAMYNFYCKNSCSSMYRNQLFIVNPILEEDEEEDDGNKHLFKCDIDIDDNYVVCIDLCVNNLKYCNDHLKYGSGSCVTSSDKYLFISGASSVTIFNMNTLNWISSSNNSLAIPISSHSCSYWNKSLYIIGGIDADNYVVTTIQICDIDIDNSQNINTLIDCYVSNTKLINARSNAQSLVIGNSIITIGGRKSFNYYIDSIEIYDAYSDNLSELSTKLIDGGRESCCLIDWKSQSKLIISGGEQFNGTNVVAMNNMIYSSYSITPHQIESVNKLTSCRSVKIDTRDYSFVGVYNFYRHSGSNDFDFYFFQTPDQRSYFIFDNAGGMTSWIHNYTESSSCFFAEDGVPDIGSGVWTKPRTRYSRTTNIQITLTCNDEFEVSNENNNNFIGLTDVAFITLIVAIFVIVLAIIIVSFCCWTKKLKYKSSKQYYYTETNKNKQNNDNDDDIKLQDAPLAIVRVPSTDDECIQLTQKRIGNQPDNDDDDDVDDDEDSSSTVPPWEVKYSKKDKKSTKILDAIEIETRRTISIKDSPPPAPKHAVISIANNQTNLLSISADNNASAAGHVKDHISGNNDSD